MNKEDIVVGELLYKEHVSKTGEVLESSLFFIDEEVVEGRQLMYTEIALLSDFGNGMEVYLGIEAGGMPSDSKMRKATDQDIQKFVEYIKEGNISDYPSTEQWIESINKDEVLLQKEKDRILAWLND